MIPVALIIAGVAAALLGHQNIATLILIGAVIAALSNVWSRWSGRQRRDP